MHVEEPGEDLVDYVGYHHTVGEGVGELGHVAGGSL